MADPMVVWQVSISLCQPIGIHHVLFLFLFFWLPPMIINLLFTAYKKVMSYLIISSAFLFLFHILLLVITKVSLAMAPRSVDNISEVSPVKESWTIVVRIVRAWFVRDVNRDAHPFSLDMVLMDASVRLFLIFVSHLKFS